jgi:hypothetical protein
VYKAKSARMIQVNQEACNFHEDFMEPTVDGNSGVGSRLERWWGDGKKCGKPSCATTPLNNHISRIWCIRPNYNGLKLRRPRSVPSLFLPKYRLLRRALETTLRRCSLLHGKTDEAPKLSNCFPCPTLMPAADESCSSTVLCRLGARRWSWLIVIDAY